MSALRELLFFNETTAAPRSHDTDLELTVPAILMDEPTHKFKKIAHVIQPGDIFTINLKRLGNPNAKSHIASYCSTTTEPTKIKVLSIEVEQAGGGTSTQHLPKTPFPAGTTGVTFKLNLAREEMILIGIILEVDRPGSPKKHYLCDPQVGNGPP